MQDLAGWIGGAQRHVIPAVSAQLLVVKKTKILAEIQLHNFNELN